ncbi:MAG: ABC-2 type transport system permease protein [Acidimicrobiales bacterium]|jgi:ABC-2 type transport system permease protein
MTTITSPETTQPASTKAPGVYAPATRSAGDVLNALPLTLKSEWVKASTILSNKVVLGLAVAVSGGMTWAVANFVTDEVLTVAEVFAFGTIFTAVFAAIGGILMYASEAQHGTMAPTLTAQTSRVVVASSKAVTAAGFGLLVGISGLIAGIGGSQLGGIAMGDTSTMLGDGGRALLFTALASILGVGVGMIARHSTAAISGLLVWWLVVENLLNAFVVERWARFLPFTAGNGLLGTSSGPNPDQDLALSLTENGLVFGAYAAVALTIGTVFFCRRDNN